MRNNVTTENVTTENVTTAGEDLFVLAFKYIGRASVGTCVGAVAAIMVLCASGIAIPLILAKIAAFTGIMSGIAFCMYGILKSCDSRPPLPVKKTQEITEGDYSSANKGLKTKEKDLDDSSYINKGFKIKEKYLDDSSYTDIIKSTKEKSICSSNNVPCLG